jgi:hypothetical protein
MCSIEDFIAYFNIEYSLLEEDEDRELIRQYYQYVSDKLLKIDHGIVAAMLLYNALMKAYKEAAAEKSIFKSESFVHNDLHYSSEYKEHIKLISSTIAKHNMWRANINNIDISSLSIRCINSK